MPLSIMPLANTSGAKPIPIQLKVIGANLSGKYSAFIIGFLASIWANMSMRAAWRFNRRAAGEAARFNDFLLGTIGHLTYKALIA